MTSGDLNNNIDGNGETMDLSHYMVLLGSFQGPHGCVDFILKTNQDFKLDPQFHASETDGWARNNIPGELSVPFFGFRWDQIPKNGEYFILGSRGAGITSSDQSPCDFQLAEDNSTGVSRMQLGIGIEHQDNADKYVTVQLRSLSGNIDTTVMRYNATWNLESKKLRRGQIMSLADPVSVSVGGLMFCIWVPMLDPAAAKQRRRLAYQFDCDRSLAPPTHLPSINAGFDTQYDNIRIAEDRTPWVYVGKLPPLISNEQPFFEVWSPLKGRMSAWQSVPEMRSSTAISQSEGPQIQRYFEISKILGAHVSRDYS
jgi:hypothetical protein